MEHNGENRNMPQTTLCRMGCGFYGSPTCEGMCSKCYKDVMQRRQQSASTSQMAGRASPTCLATGGTEAAGKVDKSQASGISTSRCSPPIDTSRTPNVETATPTVPSSSHNKAAKDQSSESLPDSHGEAEATASPRSLSPADKEKKPKKHRCHTCKKKVGLTGFECRCGGLYCSIHRYSDKHECTFNYKEMAQAQIRKNNPVVVGEKIQKI